MIWRVGGVLALLGAVAACTTEEGTEVVVSSSFVEAEPTTTIAVTTTEAGTSSTTAVERVDLVTALDTDRPVEGAVADASWVPVVEAFEDFAAQRDIGAATLAVAVEGQPTALVALGWSDLDRTEPLSIDARYRLASVTKPYTRALALELEAQGLIDLDRQVFCTPGRSGDCLLDLVAEAAEVGRPVLDEMADITVRHLIDHTAGFDSSATLDPMFAPLLIQFDLGIEGLPVERDVATWMLGEPLVHTPGEVYAYSNVGYLLAGLAMEEATGSGYLDLLRTHVDASDALVLGASLPADRAADEVEYACDEGLTVDVFDVEGPEVCWADGGFHLEAMTAHGRLVAPVSEVLAFLIRRCVDGVANLGGCNAWHDGSLSGNYAVARNFGRVDYVVLFNQRRDPEHPGFGYADVVDTLDAAILTAVGDPFTN